MRTRFRPWSSTSGRDATDLACGRVSRQDRAGARWIRHTVADADAGSTVETILVQRLGISRRMIQRLTRSRGIMLNSRPAYLARAVRVGDVVAARVRSSETSTLTPIAMELVILYEDDDLLVVDKPPGISVHPSGTWQGATLAHGVAHYLQSRGLDTRVRPVHRIDRQTSGIVIFAGSAHAQQQIDRQFARGEVEREYLVVVEGLLDGDAGSIELPIGRSKTRPGLRAVRSDGRSAQTSFTVVRSLRDATLVRAVLGTGRTHQIRVHFSALGNPVMGDRDYGARETRLIRRPALHAARIRLLHPAEDRPLEITAPLPDDIRQLVARLTPPADVQRDMVSVSASSDDPPLSSEDPDDEALQNRQREEGDDR